jgi:FkbM family methyltransferase
MKYIPWLLLILHFQPVRMDVNSEILIAAPYSWDGKPINGDPDIDIKCDNFPAKAPILSVAKPYQMCLRPENDLISNIIRQHHRWSDCDVLLELWREKGTTASNDLFVDAGGNIGSCSLFMAAAGAKVVAFEPVPSNLFYFTRSIDMNIRSGVFSRDQLRLYTVGVSNVTETAIIYSVDGNKGISLVGKVLNPHKMYENTNATITLHRLDDVLWPDRSKPPPTIRLLKIDVEGYEYRAIEGAHALFTANVIDTVKVEVSGNLLPRYGSSASALCNRLKSYGYTLYEDKNPYRSINGTEVCSRWDREKRTVDIIARLGGSGSGGGGRGSASGKRSDKRNAHKHTSQSRLSFALLDHH